MTREADTPNPWHGWAVYNRWGDIWESTIARRRNDAIAAFLRDWSSLRPPFAGTPASRRSRRSEDA